MKVGGPSAFESIIVCQAQSPEPCGPTLVPIGEIADVPVEFAKCGMHINAYTLVCPIVQEFEIISCDYRVRRGGSDSHGFE